MILLILKAFPMLPECWINIPTTENSLFGVNVLFTQYFDNLLRI